jgi:hypothetical protein
MKLLLYKDELNSFIESYESSVLKEYIKFSIHPYETNGKQGVTDTYWVKFDEGMDENANLLNFIFRAGTIHGKNKNK